MSEGQPGGIGIALSGGGIRAAAIGLGALQVSDERGLFMGARFVSSVSGGSYIATAFTASRAIIAADPTDDPDRPGERPAESAVPWARGSREEDHLRRTLRYLGEDWPDVTIALVQYLLGLVLNLVPLVASLYLVLWVVGGAFDRTDVLETTGGEWSAQFAAYRYPLALIALAVAIGIERLRLRSGLTSAVRSAALWLVVACVLPEAVVAYWHLAAGFPVGTAWVWSIAVLALVVIAWSVFRSQWAVKLTWLESLGLVALRGLLVVVAVGIVVFTVSWSLQQIVGSDRVVRSLLAALAVAVCVFFGFYVHANQTSLHGLYRNRLDRAFIALQSDPGRGPRRLSQLRFENLSIEGVVPELLVCAAVNLSGRETAQGVGCDSFVFSSSQTGGEVVGTRETSSYGAALPKGLDCATVIATSGAAIAPNMGIFTRKVLRSVLSLLNLRLGMWLPNPGHPGWDDLVASTGAQRGWVEPGPLYSWRELSGVLSARLPFVFVSDGGHWDNTGVVELLRRRCQYVFMVDAGVDEWRLGNLLRLVSLARAELGVEFALDAAVLDSTDPVLKVPFTYPESTSDMAVNYLIIMRSHISDRMPPDLVAEARGPGSFPRHSTANQFLRARDFDNYLALGRWLFDEGVRVAQLPAT